MSSQELLQTAKEQAGNLLQSIEVLTGYLLQSIDLEERVKERDEKLNLKDERIAKLEKHILLSSPAKFVCNENSFFNAEFNQALYYAGQPFKTITNNYFGVQYFEVTLQDISKFV